MLLAADIGNSSIKFGVFNGDFKVLSAFFSISSSVSRTSDELVLIINQMLSSSNLLGEIRYSVISSVVPDITSPVYDACKKICGTDPFIISAGTHTGFPIHIESHTQLGADIVSNTSAALGFTDGPLVIADFGTATTVTAVSDKNELVGTIIVPGIKISLDALYNSAALLSEVSLRRPDELIGKNSDDSMSSGVINGAILMIDGFVRNLREKLCSDGRSLSLFSTGGLSSLVVPHCRNKFTNISHLTLMGEARLFYKNIRKQ